MRPTIASRKAKHKELDPLAGHDLHFCQQDGLTVSVFLQANKHYSEIGILFGFNNAGNVILDHSANKVVHCHQKPSDQDASPFVVKMKKEGTKCTKKT